MGILRVFAGLSVRLRPAASLLGASALACACAVALPAGASAACSNEARRAEQSATYLPDCRAFEKVSPEEKGGGDIVGDGETTIAGNLGDEAFERGEGAVAYSSRTPFGDEIGSGVDGQTQYVARRRADGWASHAVTPTGRADAVQTLFTATKPETFSEDLHAAVVWGYDLPGGNGTPNRNNIYVENTDTRFLQALTLSEVDQLRWFDFLNYPVDWGVSADAQHVAFVTATQMLKNAEHGVSNVYQWDSGKGLTLAGILPGGEIPTGGSEIQPEDYRASMSADGSRLVFTAVPNNDPNGDPELYMRIDGSTTVPISTPNGSAPFSTNVHLEAVTPDGRNVFFVTESPLLPGETSGGLYRWTDRGNAAHEGVLTSIAANLTVNGTANGVVGVSDDGTRVYYQTLGNSLLVWDNGTTRSVSANVAVEFSPPYSLTAVASKPGYARVTPDGTWMAFLTTSDLLGQGTNGHLEMYVYSLRADTLTCASCPPSAAASDASVLPDVTSGTPKLFNEAIRPTFLSENGQVFFSTTEALLPEDINGVEDVYEYDGSTGLRQLVSSGTSKDPASFADASRSGDDVFIQTRQKLISEDRDNLVDLYDVRKGGGFPAPSSASPCSGDECQPQPVPAATLGVPASVGFSGTGNTVVLGNPIRRAQSNKRRLDALLQKCQRKRAKTHRKRCEAKARKRYGKGVASKGSK